MKTPAVNVPAEMLLDTHLAESAKLLWMVLQLIAQDRQAPVSLTLLERRSGLARHTILRGQARLESAGWLPKTPAGAHTLLPVSWATLRWASIPADLLLDHRVGARAKVLYGVLQLTPGFHNGRGQCSYAALSDQAGVHSATVKLAMGALLHAGWLTISPASILDPIRFALRNPIAERRDGEAEDARLRLEEAEFLGEALMREYLSLLVDSDEYEDNATPGFLVNPFTGEKMQIDRYYPPRVAFEYNGPQHYGPTARYPKETDARNQRGRDIVKSGICNERGIRLLVVRPGDLTLEAMRQRLAGLLPLRNLDGHEPLITYLETVSRSYQRKAR